MESNLCVLRPYLFSSADCCWFTGCWFWAIIAPASEPPTAAWEGASDTGTPPASTGGRGGWKAGEVCCCCCFLFRVPVLRGACSGCLLAGLQGRGERGWNTDTWQPSTCGHREAIKTRGRGEVKEKERGEPLHTKHTKAGVQWLKKRRKLFWVNPFFTVCVLLGNVLCFICCLLICNALTDSACYRLVSYFRH